MVRVWPEKVSENPTTNYNLFNRIIKKDLKLRYVVPMDEDPIDVSFFQTGMCFTKVLPESEYEFRMKRDTTLSAQGLIWDLLSEKTSGEIQNLVRSLENRSTIPQQPYEKCLQKGSSWLKVKLDGLQKDCLLPILPHNGAFLNRNAMDISKRKKLFIITEIIKARELIVSWQVGDKNGIASFENKIIGINYAKIRINEEGRTWIEDLTRKE